MYYLGLDGAHGTHVRLMRTMLSDSVANDENDDDNATRKLSSAMLCKFITLDNIDTFTTRVFLDAKDVQTPY